MICLDANQEYFLGMQTWNQSEMYTDNPESIETRLNVPHHAWKLDWCANMCVCVCVSIEFWIGSSPICRSTTENRCNKTWLPYTIIQRIFYFRWWQTANSVKTLMGGHTIDSSFVCFTFVIIIIVSFFFLLSNSQMTYGAFRHDGSSVDKGCVLIWTLNKHKHCLFGRINTMWCKKRCERNASDKANESAMRRNCNIMR